MRASTTMLLGSLAALASAQEVGDNQDLPPVNLGYFGFPHGNLFVAWTPTPTTKDELKEVCDTRGKMNGTATWTSIRAYNTYVFDPICRNPFNITDEATNITYYNLELACVDDNVPLYAEPEVTAVVDIASNKSIEACQPIATSNPLSSTGCSYSAEGLRWSFACA